MTNKIIKVLANECFYWPLCFRSGMFIQLTSDSYPISLALPSSSQHREQRQKTLGWMEPQLGQLLQRQREDICQERGPFGHHTLLLLTREGREGAIRGQENRKHVQEGHTHQQRKTDFKAITTSKNRDDSLFSHLPGPGELILSSTLISKKMFLQLQTWGSWFQLIVLPGLTDRRCH